MVDPLGYFSFQPVLHDRPYIFSQILPIVFICVKRKYYIIITILFLNALNFLLLCPFSDDNGMMVG